MLISSSGIGARTVFIRESRVASGTAGISSGSVGATRELAALTSELECSMKWVRLRLDGESAWAIVISK
jgi:hypothetical protein